MTEVEIIELFVACGENALSSFTAYISITIAFLVAAYFVGSSLTSFQDGTASGLYMLGALATFLSQIGYVQMQFELLESAPVDLQSLPLGNGDFWVASMSLVQSAGIFVCLFFMWQVIHPKSS